MTTGSPICSCWEERGCITALYRQLIPRDIGMKDSSEDLAGVRQPSCLSPPDVLLCLHPAGMSVEAADGHAFRPPWALFFFRGCHTSLGRPGPIIFCTEISAMS